MPKTAQNMFILLYLIWFIKIKINQIWPSRFVFARYLWMVILQIYVIPIRDSLAKSDIL